MIKFRNSKLALLCAALAILASRPANAAEDNIWLGSFLVPITRANEWSNGLPDADDNVIFGYPFADNDFYYLFLPSTDLAIEELTFRDDEIIVVLGGSGHYTVTGTPSDPNAVATTRIAESTGEVSHIRFETGFLTSHGGADVAVAPGTVGSARLQLGAYWTIHDTLNVGRHGEGGLFIEDRGTLMTQRSVLAAFAGSSAEVTIAGEDAIWTNSGEFIAGAAGPTTITAANGAAFTTGSTVLGAAPGFHSFAQLFSPDTHWNATSDFRIGTPSAPTEEAPATGQLDVNFGSLLTVADTLTVSENGLLQLTQGFALVGTGPAPTTPNTLEVYPDGTLAGGGQINGSVHSAGTIAPGDSTGILDVQGGLALEPTSQLVLEIAGTAPGTDHDQLAVTGAVTLDGELNVEAPSTFFIPDVGDEIQLLTYASVVGDFSSFTGLDVFFPERMLIPVKNPTDYRLVTALAGDVNRDGKVDMLDANQLSENWLATDTGYAGGDANLDGIVDGRDANLVSQNFLNEVAVPTPEPSTLLLALSAIATSLVSRRGRHTVAARLRADVVMSTGQ